MSERPLLKGLAVPDANCCPGEAAIWFGAWQHQLAGSLVGMDSVRRKAAHCANGEALLRCRSVRSGGDHPGGRTMSGTRTRLDAPGGG